MQGFQRTKRIKKTYFNQDSVMIRLKTEPDKSDYGKSRDGAGPVTGSILVSESLHHLLPEWAVEQFIDQSALQGDPHNALLPGASSLSHPSALKKDTGNDAWILLHRYRSCGTHRGSIPRRKNQSRLQAVRHQTEEFQAPVTDGVAWLLAKNRGGYCPLFPLLSGCAIEVKESVCVLDQLRMPAGKEDTASEVVKLVGAVSVLLDQLDAVIQPLTDGVGLVVLEGIEYELLVLPVRVGNALMSS